MKNKETYAKELAGIPFSELAMTKDGNICRCKEILCRDCAFYERKFPFCREAERIEAVVHTEIARLTAENAELRARLKKAVELPLVQTIRGNKLPYEVVYKDGNGRIIVTKYRRWQKKQAEARLKELQGGAR